MNLVFHISIFLLGTLVPTAVFGIHSPMTLAPNSTYAPEIMYCPPDHCNVYGECLNPLTNERVMAILHPSYEPKDWVANPPYCTLMCPPDACEKSDQCHFPANGTAVAGIWMLDMYQDDGSLITVYKPKDPPDDYITSPSYCSSMCPSGTCEDYDGGCFDPSEQKHIEKMLVFDADWQYSPYCEDLCPSGTCEFGGGCYDSIEEKVVEYVYGTPDDSSSYPPRCELFCPPGVCNLYGSCYDPILETSVPDGYAMPDENVQSPPDCELHCPPNACDLWGGCFDPINDQYLTSAYGPSENMQVASACPLFCPPMTCQLFADCYDPINFSVVESTYVLTDDVQTPPLCDIYCPPRACVSHNECYDPGTDMIVETLLFGDNPAPMCSQIVNVAQDVPEEPPTDRQGTTNTLAVVGGVLTLGAFAFLCAGR